MIDRAFLLVLVTSVAALMSTVAAKATEESIDLRHPHLQRHLGQTEFMSAEDGPPSRVLKIGRILSNSRTRREIGYISDKYAQTSVGHLQVNGQQVCWLATGPTRPRHRNSIEDLVHDDYSKILRVPANGPDEPTTYLFEIPLSDYFGSLIDGNKLWLAASDFYDLRYTNYVSCIDLGATPPKFFSQAIWRSEVSEQTRQQVTPFKITKISENQVLIPYPHDNRIITFSKNASNRDELSLSPSLLSGYTRLKLDATELPGDLHLLKTSYGFAHSYAVRVNPPIPDEENPQRQRPRFRIYRYYFAPLEIKDDKWQSGQPINVPGEPQLVERDFVLTHEIQILDHEVPSIDKDTTSTQPQSTAQSQEEKLITRSVLNLLAIHQATHQATLEHRLEIPPEVTLEGLHWHQQRLFYFAGINDQQPSLNVVRIQTEPRLQILRETQIIRGLRLKGLIEIAKIVELSTNEVGILLVNQNKEAQLVRWLDGHRPTAQAITALQQGSQHPLHPFVAQLPDDYVNFIVAGQNEQVAYNGQNQFRVISPRNECTIIF